MSEGVLLKMLVERVDELADKIDRVVRDEKMHDDHHDWIDSQVCAAKARTDFWMDVRRKVAVAGVWGTMGIVASVVWYAVVKFVEETAKTGG